MSAFVTVMLNARLFPFSAESARINLTEGNNKVAYAPAVLGALFGFYF